jgi:hypothetical protein
MKKLDLDCVNSAHIRSNPDRAGIRDAQHATNFLNFTQTNAHNGMTELMATGNDHEKLSGGSFRTR